MTCGLVEAGRTVRSPDALDRVVEYFEPFGERCGREQIDAPGLAAVVAARWTGNEPALARLGAPDDLIVAGDVRLTNAGPLATELGCSVSMSDVGLVAAAYRRWGDDCVRHLEGDFAVAVVDARRPALLLFVDHAGTRPLAVHEHDGGVAFASNPLALTGLESVGHELDLDAARAMIALTPTARTFVRGVTMLPAGSALVVTPDRRHRWRWWEPERIAIEDLGSLDRHADVLLECFDAAVGSAIGDARRVGVSLSGGLDSTSVAAAAAIAVAPAEVRTYTSVPPPGWDGPPNPAKDPDESPLVRELAAVYPNLRPRFVDVVGRGVFDGWEPLWELGAPPLRNAMNSIWARAINEDATADGVDVLLTGGVGNAAFSADGPRVLVELLRCARLGRLHRELGARAARTGQTRRRVFRTELLDLVLPPGRFPRGTSQTAADRVATWTAVTALRPESASAVDVVGALPWLGETDGTRWTRHVDRLFAWAPASSIYLAAVRTWFGLDLRDPTADRALLQVAIAQPEWWRRHDGIERAIARRAMAGRLPRAIVDRTRRGAQLPDWFDRLTESRDAVAAEVSAARDHPELRALMDVERLEALVRTWPEPDDAYRLDSRRNYRLTLMRAVLVGRYVRWFEDRSRRVAAGGAVVALPAR